MAPHTSDTLKQTTYLNHPPPMTLCSSEANHNLKRLPNNTKGATRRVIRPPQPATQPKLVLAPSKHQYPTSFATYNLHNNIEVPTKYKVHNHPLLQIPQNQQILKQQPKSHNRKTTKTFSPKSKAQNGGENFQSSYAVLPFTNRPHLGELPTIPENQEKPPTNNTTTTQNFPAIKWEDLPHPNWDEYEPDQQHLLMQLNTTQPTQSPYMTQNLIWHWCPLPIDEPLPDKDIIVKLTTKEKFHKYNQTKSSKEGSTHTGTPEIGDARRFFEQGSNRYITALIILSKITPTELDNLKLAFWNLHCQAETLNATNIHIQLANRPFKPVATMEGILALEKQFKTTNIYVHLWLPYGKLK